ncbi:hypothetical protein JCM10213_008851 [Rhodosporidiobolus nylandii]
MAGTPPPPALSHRLSADPSAGTRSIHIQGWQITSTKLPILSIPQADALGDEVDLALPEIIFGNNALVLRHDESGFEVRWDAREMLKAVKKGEGWDSQAGAGAVWVKHADEWKRGQSASTSTTASLTVQKPYDWTYTTLHSGSFSLPSSPSSAASSPSASQPAPPFSPAPPGHPGIPLAQLARTDIPILFFDEVPLFEDELGDNGIADATVRVRVNSTSVFVLSRFSLRIDGVLFRHFDVRLFHSFGSSEILREVKGREATYDAVRDRMLGPRRSPALSTPTAAPTRTGSPLVSLPNRYPYAAARSPFGYPALASGTASPQAAAPAEDLGQLNDINRVAGVLEQLALEAGMGGVPLDTSEQRGNGGQWEGLGTRLEVMRVPWTEGAAEAQ